jgi:fluoroacetyl-CoA thioesterase
MPRHTLLPGLTFDLKYTIPENKTVPFLYPEAPEFQLMPRVLATGFMVGLFEWTCIKLVNPHLDWPAEQTVGTAVNVSHRAATPPGLTVTVQTKLVKIEGRKLWLTLEARDDLDTISEGTHERFIIDAGRFNAKAGAKQRAVLAIKPT